MLICCTLHRQVIGRRAEAVFEMLHIVQCALQRLLITLQCPPHAQKFALQRKYLTVHLSIAIKDLLAHM